MFNCPRGFVQLPSGNVQLPSGICLTTLGYVQLPSGICLTALGNVQLPSGICLTTLGNVQLPSGIGLTTRGNVQLPLGVCSITLGSSFNYLREYVQYLGKFLRVSSGYPDISFGNSNVCSTTRVFKNYGELLSTFSCRKFGCASF